MASVRFGIFRDRWLVFAALFVAGAGAVAGKRAVSGEPGADCSSSLVELDRLFQAYLEGAEDIRGSALFGLNRYGRRDYRKNLRSLDGFLRSEADKPCFPAVAARYARKAFDAMTPIDRSRFSGPGKADRKDEILAALDAMAGRGLLVPLTDSRRRDYGGIWDARDNRGHPRLFGAYDCGLSSIFFDPFLPPLNLGAVMAHEFDHLLRDKLTFGTHWPETRDRVSAEERLILDEVAANLAGAIAQYRFYRDQNRDYDFEETRPKRAATDVSNLSEAHFMDQANPKRFVLPLEADFNLFSRRGAVARVWDVLFDRVRRGWTDDERSAADRAHAGAGRMDGNLRSPEAASWFRRHGRGPRGVPVFGGFDEIYAGLLEPESLEPLESVVQLVAERYFPDKRVDRSRIARLLQDWLRESGIAEAGIAPLKDALSFRFADGDASFRGITGLLGSRSPGCQALIDTIASGKLDGYAIPAASTEGVRPSEDVRPSAEGVRPSLGVKACYRPDERL